ncbi:MFS transporter [Nocardioides aromaticivorans]|uniref:MFS transporter n=1 Tax=Nocardioides aromaticivorans TaxID=200618 RepID=A0ABX7PPL1_9ACTN|nr:MFS transporter [Nocardioides aromaticivorans]QSR27905.1 MFS transporter [Nocardioides aromaticivorans]
MTNEGVTTSPRFRSLAHPNYRLYFAGSLVSNVGTWMQRVAQDWLVLTIPGNGGTALGITTGLQFLPVLLLSPYAGVIADRFPKRRMLQVTQAVMALAALALGAIAALGVAETWHVYVLAFVFGIGAAFDAPARQAFVSEMVGADDVANAVSLNSAAFNTARLIGPGIAGLLIGIGGGGMRATGWVILANAVSYAAVILQLRRMDPAGLHSPRPAGREPGMLRAGVGYLRGQPKMLMILVLVFFVGTFGMNFQLTSALMATDVFGKGAEEYGVLGSFLAIGSLSGALLAAGRARVRVRLLMGAAVAFGVLEIVAGFAPSYLLFVVLCPLLGVSVITVLNSCNALLQTESDPAMRGRVMAIYMTIVMGGTPIGSPFIGWIGEQYGARWTLVVGGVLVLVGVGLAVLVRSLAVGREPSAQAVREPAMLPS